MTFTVWHIVEACAIVAIIAAVIATIRTRQKDIKKVAYMMDALEDGELNFRFQEKEQVQPHAEPYPDHLREAAAGPRAGFLDKANSRAHARDYEYGVAHRIPVRRNGQVGR